MMVEAGGTEATWELYEAGAPKVTEEVIAEGLEEAKQWIGASIDLQQELRAAVEPAHGPIATIPYERPHRLRRRRVRRGRTTQATREHVARRWRSPTRPSATTASTRSSRACSSALGGTPDEPAQFADRAGEVKTAFRSLQKQVVRTRIVNEGVRIDGRGATDLRPLVGRGRHHPHRARLRPLPAGRDPGAVSVLTLGMPRMEQIARHDRARRPQALHAPLQLPAVLHR